MRRPAKKSMAIFSAAVLAIAGTGVAFAYWTSTGSGEGTATTGETVALTINQTSTVEDLRPGGAAQTLSGDFDNPTGNGPVFVTTVTASIGTVTKAVGAPSGTCTADDYTLADAAMDVGEQVPEGDSQGAWAGATIQFNNSATVNQDGCQGATVQILYESS